MSSGWYVACCAPHRQARVKSGIERIGHDVYLPMERLRKRKRGRMVTIARPLLGPYLFFTLDPQCQQWTPILEVDGVWDILRPNSHPSRVPTILIEALRKAERYGEFDRTPNSPLPFRMGETRAHQRRVLQRLPRTGAGVRRQK
jgi:transcription antitermination factor NusG